MASVFAYAWRHPNVPGKEMPMLVVAQNELDFLRLLDSWNRSGTQFRYFSRPGVPSRPATKLEATEKFHHAWDDKS